MSEISSVADRLAIIDVVTRMFVYTDQNRWADLLSEVFSPKVDFDGGFGGPVGVREAADIVGDWRTGLSDLDGLHHQAGNYLVDPQGDHAVIHADSIAVHSKNSATQGKTRTFIGSYSIGAERTAAGWRVDRFHYHLKIIEGNADLT